MTAALNFMSGGLANGPESFGSVTNLTLNGTGIGLAWIVQARTTSPITRVKFRYGTRAGTPPTYSIALETVDSSGNPTGTDIGGGSPTLKTFTPPADATWNSTTQEITLTNAYTPALASDVFAIVIRYSSGTCDASNNAAITRTIIGLISVIMHFPSQSTLSGGVWTKNTSCNAITWGTSTEFLARLASAGYVTSTASTAGHRSAAYLTLPAGFGTTFSVSSIALWGRVHWMRTYLQMQQTQPGTLGCLLTPQQC